MDLSVNRNNYNQSFQGLFSPKTFKDNRICGSCVEVIKECTHFAFSDEPKEVAERAIKKMRGTVRAYCMNANGFGTQLHRTVVKEGPTLSISRADYNAYKFLYGSPENTEKVEKELKANGLTNHLNGKVRKWFLKRMFPEE